MGPAENIRTFHKIQMWDRFTKSRKCSSQSRKCCSQPPPPPPVEHLLNRVQQISHNLALKPHASFVLNILARLIFRCSFFRESGDNGPTIYTFLDSKGWTEVDKYSSDDDKRSICSSTNSKTKPRIYAMRPMCPLFFDVPVGANPNLKEFAHQPIVKMVRILYTVDNV